MTRLEARARLLELADATVQVRQIASRDELRVVFRDLVLMHTLADVLLRVTDADFDVVEQQVRASIQ